MGKAAFWAGGGGGVEWSIAAGRDGSYKQENKWMMETGLRSEEGEGMRLEQVRGIREKKEETPVP